MICHQKIIRDKQAEVEHKESLFGAYWESIDLSPKNATVKEVNYYMAKEIILKYEWLGTMPLGCCKCVGLFFDWAFAGVECFTDVRKAGKFSINNRPAICLARGACVHWAPKWSGSFMVSKSIKFLDANKYDFVIAYSDTEANEIGTIYQACNWFCIKKRKNKMWVSPEGKRYNYEHHRDIANKKLGKKGYLTKEDWTPFKNDMIDNGWELKVGGARYVYAFPLGTGRDFRQRKKYLESIAIPYPKRINMPDAS